MGPRLKSGRSLADGRLTTSHYTSLSKRASCDIGRIWRPSRGTEVQAGP